MALPKDPRQLMINLMYLVLTAMLALNITKEVLTAFMTINGSIEKSNTTIIDKNNAFYKSFDEAEASSDRAKVKPYNDKAKEIKAKSEELYKFLDTWKEDIITKSGGWDIVNGIKEIKSPEDINTPTMLLVEEKKGDDIKKRLTEFSQYVLERVENPADKDRLTKQIPIQIKDLPKTEDNPNGDWTYGTFHNIPVVASVAMFSKFQNDVKNTESMVLDYLASQVYLKDIKIDAFVPMATPNTSYALEGQEIEATLVLAAYNKNINPRITSSAGAVSVKEGVGTLKFKASGAGPKTVNGVMTMETNGEIKNYPYKFNYTVGSAGASLQLDKMNVMYIGVPNPMTLSASGYNIEDVKPVMPWAELTSTGKGKYEAKVNKQGTFDYTIAASGRGGSTGGTVSSGKIRVKYIPAPTATVGGISSGKMETAKAKAQQGVIAKLENFDFDTRFEVLSFRFAYIPRNGEYGEAENPGGARFNAAVRAYMDRSKPGDKWIFENIKVKGPDGRVQTVNSITITLI
ncbi:type IX secretion system motor protein PorM/GldM [Taibaiella koreensis]|uniref:type IX secretion system motor protein PorM/GldM n=1 Tax=Taibaiella koreensis TaxID=1268548 RepID=UPI000E59EA58|nr:gliding motility protein GldM [Taibaiella koreensis]